MQMMRKFMLIGLSCLIIICAVGVGISYAEVSLGGKIETIIGTVVGTDNSMTPVWQEHLKLDFILPSMGNTSAKFEVDLFYEPQGSLGSPDLSGNVSKLYIKHRFDHCQLTLGRQPVSWSFGSLLNPVDFNQSLGLLENLVPVSGENALLAYIPLGFTSNLTLITAFPEFGTQPKVGVRGRTDLMGYDLTMNYVNSPALMGGMVPAYQQLGFTFKGDVGLLGLYGALGYTFDQTDFQDGDQVFLVGVDSSFYLENGSKLMGQLEYLHDIRRVSGLISTQEPDLLTGLISYEIDEFASLSLAVTCNPADGSILLAPVYKNLIGSGLDVSITGGIFLGEQDTEFGSGGNILGYQLPKGMLQTVFSYPF